MHNVQPPFKTLRPRQTGRHFADDIFKWNFLNDNVWIPIKISLKFVPKVRINNIPALVQIMVWRRSGDKPLSEPMIFSLLTHICVSRPQWVQPGQKICINKYWMERPINVIYLDCLDMSPGAHYCEYYSGTLSSSSGHYKTSICIEHRKLSWCQLFATGRTVGCRYDNRRCPQWRQSWTHNDSWFSVCRWGTRPSNNMVPIK